MELLTMTTTGVLMLSEYLMEGSWDTGREQDYNVKKEHVAFLVAFL